MKKMLFAVTAFVVSVAFADLSTYNDLGTFENQQNDFWDTTSHSRVDIGVAFHFDVETPAQGFDSRVVKAYLADTPISVRRYHVDPPLVILLR